MTPDIVCISESRIPYPICSLGARILVRFRHNPIRLLEYVIYAFLSDSAFVFYSVRNKSALPFAVIQ